MSPAGRPRWQIVLLAALLAGSGLALPGEPVAAAPDPRAPCRSWTSDLMPPPNIRVYRSRGPATGTVQTVDFRRYVAVVMAAEWPHWMPRETVRAGALAVKQYGWYYTVNYRGWLGPDGRCFHVVDTSNDQVYWPELRIPHARHQEAVDASWRVSLRTPTSGADSRLTLTIYRRGSSVACGADRDGRKMFQLSSRACGFAGLTAKQILRTYYGPQLEFVDVRPHDILADAGWRGDVAALSGKAGSGRTSWHVYAATAGGLRRPVSGSLAMDRAQILDSATADVTGDGLSDLVLLVRVGRLGRQLIVLKATGRGYGAPRLWSGWRESDAAQARRLLLADFTGDGLADAGVLRSLRQPRAPYPRATLQVRPALPTGGFGDEVRWWSGGFDPTLNAAYAADVTGDGRADLVVSQDRGARGLRLWVMASRTGRNGLAAARAWLDRPGWRAATTMLLPIDENRDGRDDLFAIVPRGSQGIAVHALRAQSRGSFAVSQRWQSPAGRRLPFGQLRAVALHVDSDGRGDLALFSRAGTRDVSVFWLRTTDTGMEAGRALRHAGLRWAGLRPY